MKRNPTVRNVIAALLAFALSTGVAAAGQDELIWYYCCAQESRARLFEGWAREYEAQNPHVKINALHPTTGSGTYYSKVMVAMAGGVGPDVVWLGGGFPNFVEGFLLPLDDVIARSPDLQSIYPNIMKNNAWEGKQLAIPFGINVSAVYYNSDLLARAGVVIPEGWTWDDLVSIGKLLTQDRNGDGVLDAFGFSFDYNNANWYYGYGGSPFDAGMRAVRINNGPNAAGFQVLADILSGSAGAGVPIGFGPGHANGARRPAWYSEQIAMHVDGVFQLQEFPQYANFEWDVAPIPGLAYDGQVLRSEPMSLESWAVWSQTPHKEEALKFLEFISHPDRVAAFSAVGGIVPTMPQAMSDFLNADEPAVNRAVFLDALNHIGASYLEQHPIFEGQRATVRRIQTEIFTGTIPPQSGLEQIEAILNQALREYWSAR